MATKQELNLKILWPIFGKREAKRKSVGTQLGAEKKGYAVVFDMATAIKEPSGEIP
jgi:hypothetical protein